METVMSKFIVSSVILSLSWDGTEGSELWGFPGH